MNTLFYPRYDFKPTDDITVQEIAQILAKAEMSVGPETFDALDYGAQRHFKPREETPA